MFTKLLPTKIVANKFCDDLSNRNIKLDVRLLLDFNFFNSVGDNEKKPISEPEINADNISNKHNKISITTIRNVIVPIPIV